MGRLANSADKKFGNKGLVLEEDVCIVELKEINLG
jgi:hypothetical protein